MNKFKITLATVASALCGLTGVANAEYVGAVTKITDHYKTVIERDAYDVEVCYNEQVSGDKTGDTLKGAIIGGIIGTVVGIVTFTFFKETGKLSLIISLSYMYLLAIIGTLMLIEGASEIDRDRKKIIFN